MKIFNKDIQPLIILLYSTAIIALGLIYKYANYITQFVLLPSPLISYNVLKLFSFAIKDELLKSLLEMRMNVEKQIYNIDLVPMILCVGHKPFDIHVNTFTNKYLSYTITSKFVLLHIMPEYYIQVIKILESIWNGKPFHSIIVHASITNKDIFNTINNLNLIYKNTTIDAPLFIYFDFNIPNNTLKNIDTNYEIGFEITSNAMTSLYDNYQQFIDKLLNVILLNNHIGYYDVIYYLQNNMKDLVDYIYAISNCDFTLSHVFFHNSENANINSLLYTLNNIITSKCSETKFKKHSMYSRINKFLLLIIAGIVGVCGYILYSNVNMNLAFYNDVYEVTNTLKTDKIKLSDDKTKEYNFSQNVSSILIQKPNIWTKTFIPIVNIKELRKMMFKNLSASLNNMNIKMENIEFANNPTYTQNFITLKTLIENCIDTYTQIHNIHTKQTIKSIDQYKQTLQNNIIYIHDQWLQSLNEFVLIKKTNELNKLLNNIYKNTSNINDFKLFLQQCNELQTLFTYTYNDWWIENKLNENYDNFIDSVRKIPQIGNELASILLHKKDITLRSIHNSFIYNTHALIQNNHIFEIREAAGKKIINFSESIKQLIFTIENILKDELLCLNDNMANVPVLNKTQYFIWNEATIQKILAYKTKYFAFITKLNNQSNALSQSLIQICSDRLYKYIYTTLIQESIIVSSEYPINKVAININNNYLQLKEIIQFIQINLNKNISYINDIHKHNIHVIYEQVKKMIHKSILLNYQFINDWNGNNDIIQVLFSKSASQLPDLVENMILNFKQINSDIIDNILNAAYEQTTYEFAYFKYLNSTIKGYENGMRNDLGKAKEFLLSLSNINLKSQVIPSADIDTTHDIAFYTQIFKTSVQSRINEIILSRSKTLFNELVVFYNENLKDFAPFAMNAAPAKVEHILTFINKYKSIRPYLMEDTELCNKYINIKNDIAFLDNLVNFFIIENNKISINVEIEEYNDAYAQTAVNTNIILKYIYKFGGISQEDPLNINYKYNIADSFQFTLQIANTSTMEIAPYANDAHVITKSNMLMMKYANMYGLFDFVNKLNVARIGKYNENVVLRIPVNIVSFNNNTEILEQDIIVTYLLVKNWPNIHNYTLNVLN